MSKKVSFQSSDNQQGNLVVIDCGSSLVEKIYDYLNNNKVPFQRLKLETTNQMDILNQIKETKPKGIIISGSGDHIYDGGRILPTEFKDWVCETKTPTLGICYGHQMLGSLFDGEVIINPKGREEDDCKLIVNRDGYPLFKDLPNAFNVFMIHFDIISKLPKNFQNFGSTGRTTYAAIQLFSKTNEPLPIFGVQFHPESSSILVKNNVFGNFLAVCGLYIKN
jgi:GMP synthase (glutamine-hydrolysing)